MLRRKDDELTDQQSLLAVRYASIMAEFTLFQGLSALLLYIAIALAQVPAMLSDSNAPFASFSLWIIVALAVMFVALSPGMIRQGRRAQRYAREHRSLLKEAPGSDREQAMPPQFGERTG